MIRLKDFLAVLHQSDRLQIIKDGKPIYTGYLALIVHNPQIEAEMDAVITLFRAVPEIKHKQWREWGVDGTHGAGRNAAICLFGFADAVILHHLHLGE